MDATVSFVTIPFSVSLLPSRGHPQSVERVVMTGSHLFAYTSGVEAYIVPRRAFRNESEFATFVNELQKRAGVEAQSSD